MSKAGLSESIQDYLKSVYKLEAEHGRVTIGALAKDQSGLACVGVGDGEEARRARSCSSTSPTAARS